MVYLPTFTIKNQLKVGEYTIHGWYVRIDVLKIIGKKNDIFTKWRCHGKLHGTKDSGKMIFNKSKTTKSTKFLVR